jgi:hypothetical protein
MSTMKVKDFSIILNTPEAYKAPDGDLTSHYLPPYAPRPAYAIDEYPHAPAGWVRGGAEDGAFFVPVQAERGMWLDFNANQHLKHHVAILLSIQGINPLTGLKTQGSGLEQYLKCCPKHGAQFQSGRHCPECGYKWPKQNYLATTGTPQGLLWLDGFRAEDGQIRQYVFTKDQLRGVAAQIIGEDRVFAIAASFYLSKTEKPTPLVTPRIRSNWKSPILMGNAIPLQDDASYNVTHLDKHVYACSLGDTQLSAKKRMATAENILRSRVEDLPDLCSEIEPENLEIAAGARIDQHIYDDPEDLRFWREKPETTIYICYCTEAVGERILKAGKRKEKTDGFLAELKTGH